jgi:hypothetical protein
MPTATSRSASYRGEYLAPKKYTLVVSCVDARLLDDTVRFLDHDNLTNRYYHVAIPGAALCVCGAPLKSGPTSQPPLKVDAWWTALSEQFLLTLKLTKFELTDVYVLQHRDCGAYKVYLDDYYGGGSAGEQAAEAAVHTSHVELLRDRLADEYKKTGSVPKLAREMNKEFKPGKPVYDPKPPNVRGFLMDLRGGVDLFVGVPGDRLWDGTPV